MNILNQINLVMFSTTIGHQGRQNIYKYTLKQLDKIFGLDNFASKFVAIKVHNNDEDTFNAMAKDYKGFSILKEYGKVKLVSNPHESESSYAPYMTNNYSVSIANTFSMLPLNATFTLWVEDDCYLRFKHNTEEFYLEQAIKALNNNVFSVHVNGPNHGFNNDEIIGPGKYAFRPHLFKTEKMFNVAQVFKANYERIKYVHPEMIYEQIIRNIYPNQEFVQFNPDFVDHIHLGGPDFPEIERNMGLTLN